MAAEMPAQVTAVEGAVVVDFPWAAAGTAVSALNAAVAVLGPQLETRGGMVPTLVDWRGAYRDEFDTTLGRITTTASGLKETMARLASSIVSGAEAANTEQRTNNTRATEPATAVPRGGRQIPV
jgi:hypothetical protein